MTKEEFLKPYLLLVFQPWGRRYDLSTPEGQTQSEFYYSQLAWVHPHVWQSVAQRYAQGKEWPALDDLKLTLRAINQDYVKALPEPPKQYITKEEFGLDLYECIKLFSGRHQIREYIRRLEKKEEDEPLTERERFTLTGHRTKEKELTEQITVLMPKLSATDQRRLLDRYESQGAA